MSIEFLAQYHASRAMPWRPVGLDVKLSPPDKLPRRKLKYNSEPTDVTIMTSDRSFFSVPNLS